MDFENKNSADNLKLFYPSSMYKNLPAKALARTRANNLIACNALSTFLCSQGEIQKNSMNHNGIPVNYSFPREADEYYTALDFFKEVYNDEKGRNFLKNSSAMGSLQDLYTWSSIDEYRNVVVDCYLREKVSNTDMIASGDIDLRKIANLFAKDGNCESCKLVEDPAKLKSIDKTDSQMLTKWKEDMVNFYAQKHPDSDNEISK